jgi:hypothetical protein
MKQIFFFIIFVSLMFVGTAKDATLKETDKHSISSNYS